MKTLRAFFWGSVIGAILGYLFAPRHTDLLRMELETGQGTPAGSTSASARGRFIGNSHTKVYHPATDTNLPEVENRVYFDSASDAEALGYRPAAHLSNAS